VWSRVPRPQWLLSGGLLIAEVWRDSLGVEQITGSGRLVCDHHRSVSIVSGGLDVVCRVGGTCVSRGRGLPIFILWEGRSTWTLRRLCRGETLLAEVEFILSFACP
jgi:hypothetical protein